MFLKGSTVSSWIHSAKSARQMRFAYRKSLLKRDLLPKYLIQTTQHSWLWNVFQPCILQTIMGKRFELFQFGFVIKLFKFYTLYIRSMESNILILHLTTSLKSMERYGSSTLDTHMMIIDHFIRFLTKSLRHENCDGIRISNNFNQKCNETYLAEP
jgi:hypothetical protein